MASTRHESPSSVGQLGRRSHCLPPTRRPTPPYAASCRSTVRRHCGGAMPTRKNLELSIRVASWRSISGDRRRRTARSMMPQNPHSSSQTALLPHSLSRDFVTNSYRRSMLNFSVHVFSKRMCLILSCECHGQHTAATMCSVARAGRSALSQSNAFLRRSCS